MAAKARKRPSPAQSVTPGSNIRFEQPKSGRKPKPRAISAATPVRPVTGFFQFLRENAVVGLAVGFIVGAQAQVLVKQLVASFIDPAFVLLGGTALSKRTFTIHFDGREAAFGWGLFVYTLLNFLFVLAAIYFIIRFFGLDRLDKKKDK